MLNVHSQEHILLKYHSHRIIETVATIENADISSHKTSSREIHIALFIHCIHQTQQFNDLKVSFFFFLFELLKF